MNFFFFFFLPCHFVTPSNVSPPYLAANKRPQRNVELVNVSELRLYLCANCFSNALQAGELNYAAGAPLSSSQMATSQFITSDGKQKPVRELMRSHAYAAPLFSRPFHRLRAKQIKAPRLHTNPPLGRGLAGANAAR